MEKTVKTNYSDFILEEISESATATEDRKRKGLVKDCVGNLFK